MPLFPVPELGFSRVGVIALLRRLCFPVWVKIGGMVILLVVLIDLI